MPIITPAYPSMCATHNITTSTKAIITKELERGGDIVDKIFTGQLKWKDLFDKHEFFTTQYKYYLSITCASLSKEAQQIWSGLIESKVRHLVIQLEQDEHIEVAHPFTKGFDRIHKVRNEAERDVVLNGSLQYQAEDTQTETTDGVKDIKHMTAAQAGENNIPLITDIKQEEPNGTEYTTVYSTTYYVGIDLVKGISHDLSHHYFDLVK
jgi:poly(A) polymerase